MPVDVFFTVFNPPEFICPLPRFDQRCRRGQTRLQKGRLVEVFCVMGYPQSSSICCRIFQCKSSIRDTPTLENFHVHMPMLIMPMLINNEPSICLWFIPPIYGDLRGGLTFHCNHTPKSKMTSRTSCAHGPYSL